MTKAVKRFGNVENSLRGGLKFYADIQVCYCCLLPLASVYDPWRGKASAITGLRTSSF